MLYNQEPHKPTEVASASKVTSPPTAYQPAAHLCAVCLPLPLPSQAAFNAFLSAGPHEVVHQIQQGKVATAQDVPAAAAAAVAQAATAKAAKAGGIGPGSEPGPPLRDWLLAEKAVEEEVTSGQIKVGWLGGGWTGGG